VSGCVRIGLALTASALFLGATKQVVEAESGEETRDGMVLIPGGCFLFGPSGKTCSHQNEERAVERMCLQAYWMDKSEVTTEQYQKCVNSGICASAGEPELPQQEREIGNGYPVVRVGWRDASNYCKWSQKRLPTDWEWERASRGPNMSCYPWGNGPPNATRVTQHKCNNLTFQIRRVCTKPRGTTPEGICDMADNALEFVSGWWDAKQRQIRNGEPERDDLGSAFRIVRGGVPGMHYRSWDRTYEPVRDVDEKSTYAYGFRCARDGVSKAAAVTSPKP